MKLIDILLVEDNQDDIRLTQEVFKRSKINNRLYVVKDGEEALHFLRKNGNYKHVPLPDLILLDLNLPKIDGKEVLREIKSDIDLKHVPVIILAASEEDEDILRAYGLNANCYITKPIDLDQFVKIVKTIEDFWLGIVRLPKKIDGYERNRIKTVDEHGRYI